MGMGLIIFMIFVLIFAIVIAAINVQTFGDISNEENNPLDSGNKNTSSTMMWMNIITLALLVLIFLMFSYYAYSSYKTPQYDPKVKYPYEQLTNAEKNSDPFMRSRLEAYNKIILKMNELDEATIKNKNVVNKVLLKDSDYYRFVRDEAKKAADRIAELDKIRIEQEKRQKELEEIQRKEREAEAKRQEDMKRRQKEAKERDEKLRKEREQMKKEQMKKEQEIKRQKELEEQARKQQEIENMRQQEMMKQKAEIERLSNDINAERDKIKEVAERKIEIIKNELDKGNLPSEANKALMLNKKGYYDIIRDVNKKVNFTTIEDLQNILNGYNKVYFRVVNTDPLKIVQITKN